MQACAEKAGMPEPGKGTKGGAVVAGTRGGRQVSARRFRLRQSGRMRQAAAAAVVVATGATVVAAPDRVGRGRAPVSPPSSAATSSSARRSSGTLGYGDAPSSRAPRRAPSPRLPSRAPWSSAVRSLFDVDAQGGPAALRRRSRCTATSVRASSDGADVRQLEENLVALGFGDGVTVDDALRRRHGRGGA